MCVRTCPKHSKKATVKRDCNDAGNRTATSVLDKGLSKETEGGVSASSCLLCSAQLCKYQCVLAAVQSVTSLTLDP